MHQPLSKTARVLIVNRNKALFCRSKGAICHFLPGWDIGYGEKAEQTIVREMQDNLKMTIRSCSYIGAVGYDFLKLDGRTDYKYDLIYHIEVSTDSVPAESSGRVDFIWKEIKYIADLQIAPEGIKENILNWLNDKKVFISS